MAGFQSPNYTQIPNDLFDEWLPRLGYAELKVLLCLLRATLGYHRARVRLSIKEIARNAGLSVHHSFDAGTQLELIGLVHKIVSPGMPTEWEVIITDESHIPFTLGENRYSPSGERGIHPAKAKLGLNKERKSFHSRKEIKSPAQKLADFLEEAQR